MLVFIFEFLLIGFLWFISSFSNSKIVKTFTKIVAYSSILFLSCFRSMSIDPDTPAYVKYFDLFHGLSWQNALDFRSFEIGDVFLFKIIGAIWFNSRFFIVVMSLLTTLPIFIFIEKQSRNVFLSLLIFIAMDFWFGSILLMRQFVAIAFCLLAYSFVFKKGLKSFFLFYFCVFIACLFHQVAVFFAPVYFLRFLKNNIYYYFVFLILFAFFLVFGGQIISVLNRFSRIQYTLSNSGGTNLLLFLLFVAIAIPLLSPSFIKEQSLNRFLYLMLLYSILIQVLALSMGNMTRAARFSLVSIVVLIPNFLDYYFKQKVNMPYQYLSSFLAFAFFGLFFMASLMSNNNSITNYMFMWE